MNVNGTELKQMIDESFAPGHNMVDAFAKMYNLVLENDLQNDLRYTESSLILLDSMTAFQNLCVERGTELCKMKAIIEALEKKPLGRYLIKKVMKELEP